MRPGSCSILFFLPLPFLPSSISSRPSAEQHFHLGNWVGAAARLDRGHVRGCDAPSPPKEAKKGKTLGQARMCIIRDLIWRSIDDSF